MPERKRRLCPTRSTSTLGPRGRYGCPNERVDGSKYLVRRYYEDVLAGRRFDLLEELIAPDFIGHDSAGATMDRAGYFAGIRALHDAFGTLTIVIEDQIAEKDRVTTRWSAIATHTGVYAGFLPTGRGVLMAGTDIHRLDRGRIVELWEQVDFASLLAQLR